MAYTLTYIGATWCKTCANIKPAVETLVQRYGIPMTTLDYDTDLEDDVKNTVRKVPTLRITSGGTLVAEFTVRQVESLHDWLGAHIVVTAGAGTTDF